MWINEYTELFDRKFDQSADVWRFDTGGIYVGDVSADAEATWVGTVALLIKELSDQGVTYEMESR